jgi:hypothetical protein
MISGNATDNEIMRKIPWFLISTIVLLISIATSCCKKTEPDSSERVQKYLGDWEFHYSWTRSRTVVPLTIYSGGSSDFTGTISSAPGGNSVTIVYPGNSITKMVEGDGRILNTCGASAPSHWSISCDGYFSGDSILYYNTYEQSPPNQIQIYSTELVGRKAGRSIKGKAPAVVTTSATNVIISGATLGTTVNPNFLPTTITFFYGTMQGSYIYNRQASPGVISGSVESNVSVTISGLTAGTTYYFIVKAVNPYGTTYGSETAFTTPG